MYRITFLAPYPSAIPLIEEVFRVRPDRDQIQYEILPDYYNNQLQHVSGEAIISRGFTAHTMKRLHLPGAELTASGYDVVRAVDQCVRRCPGAPIAVIGAFNLIHGSEVLSRLYQDRDIRTYAIRDETNLEDTIRRALREGAQAVVVGPPPATWPVWHGVPAVLIESGWESIDESRHHQRHQCHRRGPL